MPYAPARHCPHGHPAFTGPRCPQCARRTRAEADALRPNAAARGYGPKWRAARAAFLRDHPICVECGAQATVVDHHIAHKGNQELFWRRSNWQPLCKPCHDRKTAKHDGAFGRRPRGVGHP
ncbi:MAG: HNH endonuclease [Methylocystis sp.]|uniref:HNH endonuclease n=1 Tax=Methylocystis sp. TaxID=1911079 RepID=UPI003DA6194D